MQKVVAGLQARGVSLMLAVDMMNVMSMLTISHAMTEHRAAPAGEPPPIDSRWHALLLNVIMASANLDPAAEDERRYHDAIDAIILGYSALLDAAP